MIGIIEYGAGNVASVGNALQKLGYEFFISNKSDKLAEANKLIFPGVGSGGAAMQKLHQYNLTDFIKDYTKPLLGICLGMQVFAKHLVEDNVSGIGIIDVKTGKFNSLLTKVPHMGWNSVKHNNCELFNGIDNEEYFYFANSYYIPVNQFTIATSEYNLPFAAAINKNNFYGVQFHPEKSGEAGLKLLTNFCEI